MRDYDIIIVGAGAAGGIVAGVLAEAGKHVLLLERGRNLSFEDVGRDHLRNQRISVYGHNAGPDIEGNPRVFVDRHGVSHTIRPHEGGYSNNAACVGGGTRVYLAQAWRFMEQDFRMASLYGVPEGSSLADWPVTYAELEPYYERAEWEIGVCGDGEGNLHQSPRRKPYPMPPMSPSKQRGVMERAASSLGWNAFPVPFAINSVPYHNRPACIRCTHCVGFACPVDAKNGTQNTMIPRALTTGNCELVTQAMTECIETDAQGKVTGVTFVVEENGIERRETARAKVVVVSCGAVESARLLLNSATSHHPHGLGNESDQVGRHLQGHYYPGVLALLEDPIYDGLGPNATTATCQFNHGNPGVLGGGMLADEVGTLPIILWKHLLPPDLSRWGAENKRWMRENYRRFLRVMGPVHEIPSPDARVTLDPEVRDRFGLPVARLSGTTHPETVNVSNFMWEKARDWVTAAGAVKLWGSPPGLGLSGGQHQAGTCRMGNDPKTSVTDSFGRVHAHDNLYVVDGSLNVTNGGFNPFLTIMALAFRSAEHLAKAH
jgi:choline dehydrogenase-like flavoprotein